MKILIIEDEKDLREVMTRSLEKERFVVETAADYSTALQKINDYDYDCILLDIMKTRSRDLISVPMITSRNHSIWQNYTRG